MRGYWRLALAGGAAYLLFLLMSMPAERATRLLANNVAGLELQAVSGTLFSGQVQRAVIHGIAAGPIAWSLRPLALLTGHIEYRLDLRDPAIRGNGAIGRGLVGQIYLHDLDVTLQPDRWINQFSPLPIKTSGDMRLRIESLRLVDGFPDGLAGRMDWTNARIVEPATLALGHVEATVNSGGDGLLGHISGQGETTLSGEFSLTRQGDYSLSLLVTPGSGVSADVIDGLNTFGQARPGGAYLITDSGRL